MKMVRLLIQVPEPIKARLDALRIKGTTSSGFIRHCWSSISIPFQRQRKDGERWHEQDARTGAYSVRRIRPARCGGLCGSITKGRSGDSDAFKNKTDARDFYEKAKQEQKQGAASSLSGINTAGKKQPQR